MDFVVFPYTKSFLRGMRFDNLSELRQAVMNVIFHMKTDQFVHIFDDWVRRHKQCVELRRKKLNWFEHLTSLNVKNCCRCAPGVSMLIYKIETNLYLQFIFIYKILFTYRVNSTINENCNFFCSTN